MIKQWTYSLFICLIVACSSNIEPPQAGIYQSNLQVGYDGQKFRLVYKKDDCLLRCKSVFLGEKNNIVCSKTAKDENLFFGTLSIVGKDSFTIILNHPTISCLGNEPILFTLSEAKKWSQIRTIAKDNSPIFQEATTESDSIGSLSASEIIAILKRDKQWFYIETTNQKGWVNYQYFDHYPN